MAGIDKLYVKDFYEYDCLRKWAIVYYPELLFYFYNIADTYSDWEERRSEFVKASMKRASIDHNKLGDYKNRGEAIANLIEHYRITAGYNCPGEQAKDEVNYIIEAYHRPVMVWEQKYTTPIMNTPLSVDKKLKWICPIPFVREYLHKQCGVNQKYEWLYSLFWRGKKHF